MKLIHINYVLSLAGVIGAHFRIGNRQLNASDDAPSAVVADPDLEDDDKDLIHLYQLQAAKGG